jgi:hypothetical protein
MGDILKKITELLENGGNYEQSRSTGIVINSNWFDAVDFDNELSLPGSGKDKKTNSAGTKKTIRQTLNDIP